MSDDKQSDKGESWVPLNSDGTLAENAPQSVPDGPEDASEAKNESDSVSEEKIQAQASNGQETLILTDEMVANEADEPKAPEEGDMGVKAPDEAPKMVTTQNETIVTAKMSKKSHKKGLIIALILTLVLAAGVIVAWYFMAGPGKDNGEEVKKEPETGAQVEGSDGQSGEVEEVEVGNPTIRLTVNDKDVKKVYDYFRYLTPYAGRWDFYVDESVLSGNTSRDRMKLVAFDNLVEGDCVGQYEDDGGWPLNACVSGEAMKAKIVEIFGQELVFEGGETIQNKNACGHFVYDASYDEFHATFQGCGGFASEGLERLLYEAERDDDYLYLYEKVLWHNGDEATDGMEQTLSTIGQSDIRGGEFLLKYEASYDPEKVEEQQRLIDETLKQYGTKFKWVFRKTDDGNYVFEKLERLD